MLGFSFLWVWPRWFRRLSHLSEREEFRSDHAKLSTLSRAALRVAQLLLRPLVVTRAEGHYAKLIVDERIIERDL